MQRLWLLLVLAAAACSDGPPSVDIVAATEMGALVESSFIRGRDGGYSVAAFGRSVWFFGDTTLDVADERGEQWLHDSWAWTDNLDAGSGITLQDFPDSVGAPTEPFPFTEEEALFNASHAGDPCEVEPCGARWAMWPGAAVYDAARARVVVFYGKISAEPGRFNSVGEGLATWAGPGEPVERPIARPDATEPTLLFEPSEPPFGNAAWVDGDTLYAWGCRLKRLKKPCYVARVPLATVLDRSAWRFWDGGDWSAEIGDAKSVFDGNDILSVLPLGESGQLLALYSKPLTRDVMIRTAPSPQGPWSDDVRAFVAEKPESNEGWIYDAIVHPEFAEQAGMVQYVTYSRITGFFESELRLVRLELEDSSSPSEP